MNKLKILSKKTGYINFKDNSNSIQIYESGFEEGFKKAFQIIDENLAVELVKLVEFLPNGERLMTLKLYKAKIAGILKEMEQDYE